MVTIANKTLVISLLLVPLLNKTEQAKIIQLLDLGKVCKAVNQLK